MVTDLVQSGHTGSSADRTGNRKQIKSSFFSCHFRPALLYYTSVKLSDVNWTRRTTEMYAKKIQILIITPMENITWTPLYYLCFFALFLNWSLLGTDHHPASDVVEITWHLRDATALLTDHNSVVEKEAPNGKRLLRVVLFRCFRVGSLWPGGSSITLETMGYCWTVDGAPHYCSLVPLWGLIKD